MRTEKNPGRKSEVNEGNDKVSNHSTGIMIKSEEEIRMKSRIKIMKCFMYNVLIIPKVYAFKLL